MILSIGKDLSYDQCQGEKEEAENRGNHPDQDPAPTTTTTTGGWTRLFRSTDHLLVKKRSSERDDDNVPVAPKENAGWGLLRSTSTTDYHSRAATARQNNIDRTTASPSPPSSSSRNTNVGWKPLFRSASTTDHHHRRTVGQETIVEGGNNTSSRNNNNTGWGPLFRRASVADKVTRASIRKEVPPVSPPATSTSNNKGWTPILRRSVSNLGPGADQESVMGSDSVIDSFWKLTKTKPPAPPTRPANEPHLATPTSSPLSRNAGPPDSSTSNLQAASGRKHFDILRRSGNMTVESVGGPRSQSTSQLDAAVSARRGRRSFKNPLALSFRSKMNQAFPPEETDPVPPPSAINSAMPQLCKSKTRTDDVLVGSKQHAVMASLTPADLETLKRAMAQNQEKKHQREGLMQQKRLQTMNDKKQEYFSKLQVHRGNSDSIEGGLDFYPKDSLTGSPPMQEVPDCEVDALSTQGVDAGLTFIHQSAEEKEDLEGTTLNLRRSVSNLGPNFDQESVMERKPFDLLRRGGKTSVESTSGSRSQSTSQLDAAVNKRRGGRSFKHPLALSFRSKMNQDFISEETNVAPPPGAFKSAMPLLRKFTKHQTVLASLTSADLETLKHNTAHNQEKNQQREGLMQQKRLKTTNDKKQEYFSKLQMHKGNSDSIGGGLNTCPPNGGWHSSQEGMMHTMMNASLASASSMQDVSDCEEDASSTQGVDAGLTFMQKIVEEREGATCLPNGKGIGNPTISDSKNRGGLLLDTSDHSDTIRELTKIHTQEMKQNNLDLLAQYNALTSKPEHLQEVMTGLPTHRTLDNAPNDKVERLKDQLANQQAIIGVLSSKLLQDETEFQLQHAMHNAQTANLETENLLLANMLRGSRSREIVLKKVLNEQQFDHTRQIGGLGQKCQYLERKNFLLQRDVDILRNSITASMRAGKRRREQIRPRRPSGKPWVQSSITTVDSTDEDSENTRSNSQPSSFGWY